MKKVMFSAIAMIAFSGLSMANSIKVENFYTNLKDDVVESAMVERNCRAEQAATIQYAKEVIGMNDKDANTAGFMMFFSCKSDNVGNMNF
jgi:hypothetical protein